MTTPQTLIFSVTFLAISLLVNLFLFIDQADLKKEFDLQTKALSELQNQVSQNIDFKSQQLEKLSLMGGQQSELASFIKDLQQELVNLSEEYKLSAFTAEQTKKQLNSAQQKITELAEENIEQRKKLAQAEITIRNQLRALRTALPEKKESTEYQSTLSTLTTTLTPDYADITIAQATNGDVVISVPLELIFTSTLEFTDQAERILTPIAQQILALPNAEINVIGHSDSRPITSDLAKSYPTNWELSSVRASKIVSFFNNKGIKDEQLIASGKASNQPVRDENNSIAWAINRRIEIRIH